MTQSADRDGENLKLGEGVEGVTVDPIADEITEASEAEALLFLASSQGQEQEASVYANLFLKKIIRIKGVRISREDFLWQELSKAKLSNSEIVQAIDTTPLQAGISRKTLDKLAAQVISYETKKSSAISFVTGIPGGLAMLGTVPADLTQYYVHALRIMQKLAYIYGWHELIDDVDDIDDETMSILAVFFGVMLGVDGASRSLKAFARTIAAPAVQKHVARQTLRKTTWYPVVRKSLSVIGISVSKNTFARTVSKVIPLIGGVVSGGLTFVTLQSQSNTLKDHLRQLPPPGVDAAGCARGERSSS